MLSFQKEIIKELNLVDVEQGNELRKIGFDWCDETPTLELAIKWFRVEKEYFIDVGVKKINNMNMPKYKYRGRVFIKSFGSILIKSSYCYDYDEAKSIALSIAIQEYLKDLSLKNNQI